MSSDPPTGARPCAASSAELFADLTISGHSRPRVSNDNPFSEAQFRTLKYRPEFPDRFGSLEHARTISHDLLTWYNDASQRPEISRRPTASRPRARVLDRRHHTRLAAYTASRIRQRTGGNLAHRGVDQSASPPQDARRS